MARAAAAVLVIALALSLALPAAAQNPAFAAQNSALAKEFTDRFNLYRGKVSPPAGAWPCSMSAQAARWRLQHAPVC